MGFATASYVSNNRATQDSDMHQLYVSGYGLKGQLGTGENHVAEAFTRATSFDGNKYSVEKIVRTFGQHILLLARDNETKKQVLLGCGDNYYGLFGTNSTKDHATFVPVSLEKLCDKKIQKITSGDRHVILLTEDNKLFSIGNNSHGQANFASKDAIIKQFTLLEGTQTANNSQIKKIVGGNGYSLFLYADGKAYIQGTNYGSFNFTQAFSFTPLPISSPIKRLYSGPHSIFALTQSNQVYALGVSASQAGLSSTPKLISFPFLFPHQQIQRMAINFDQAFFLTNDNQVMVMGKNNDNDFNLGFNTDIPIPVFVPLPAELKNKSIMTIHSSHGNNLVLVTHDREVYGLGKNVNGELGVGNTTRVNVLTRIPIPNTSAAGANSGLGVIDVKFGGWTTYCVIGRIFEDTLFYCSSSTAVKSQKTMHQRSKQNFTDVQIVFYSKRLSK